MCRRRAAGQRADSGGFSLKTSRTGTAMRTSGGVAVSALTVDEAEPERGSAAASGAGCNGGAGGSGATGGDRGRKSRAIMSESFF